MPRKLTEEQRGKIIEVGIKEFADQGYRNANTNVIAKKAGVSVGFLFKMYKSKEDFFLACLEESLTYLREAIESSDLNSKDPIDKVRSLVKRLISFSREHGDYIRMYNEITAIKDSDMVKVIASEIESVSAKAYSGIIRKGQDDGLIRSDISPEKAAFLFDNLMMMLQFSYSCDYYKERMKVYTGDDPEDESMDDVMIESVVSFVERALCN